MLGVILVGCGSTSTAPASGQPVRLVTASLPRTERPSGFPPSLGERVAAFTAASKPLLRDVRRRVTRRAFEDAATGADILRQLVNAELDYMRATASVPCDADARRAWQHALERHEALVASLDTVIAAADPGGVTALGPVDEEARRADEALVSARDAVAASCAA
jgi:hypothetical protein